MIKIIQMSYEDSDTLIKAIVSESGSITFECGNPNKWRQDKNDFTFINSKPQTILKVCKSMIALVKTIQNHENKK
jgi:hypothetical protein